MKQAALIAVGGNALIAEHQRGTIAEQFANASEIARQVAALVESGWRIVVTHGNGPQVGFIFASRGAGQWAGVHSESQP